MTRPATSTSTRGSTSPARRRPSTPPGWAIASSSLRAGAVVKLLGVDLRGGNAGVFQGGGAYAGSGAQLIAFDSSIRGNRAGLGAGIAATAGAVVKLQSSDVSSNAASHAIYLSSSTLELVDSTVADNQGAGITVSGSVVNVFSSTISGNTASGLHAAGSSSVTLRNATVSGNGMLDLPRGGGLLIEGPATANLYYSTVAGNEAMTGGGVNITGSLTLKGSIIGANRAAYLESRLLQRIGDDDDAGLQPDPPRGLRPGAGSHRSRGLRPAARRAGGLGRARPERGACCREALRSTTATPPTSRRSISAPRAARATAISTPSRAPTSARTRTATRSSSTPRPTSPRRTASAVCATPSAPPTPIPQSTAAAPASIAI